MTNYGLNLLLYYYLDQADRFAADAEEDVVQSNPRFQFILAVRRTSMSHSCMPVDALYASIHFYMQHQDDR